MKSEHSLEYLISNIDKFKNKKWIAIGPRQYVNITSNCVHAVVSLTNSSLYGCMYVEHARYQYLQSDVANFIKLSQEIRADIDDVKVELKNSLELWRESCKLLKVKASNQADIKYARSVKKAVKTAETTAAELLSIYN